MEKNENLKKEEAPAFRHSIPVQMRFNDLDALGHVNNTVYFTYYDLGKTAYFTTIRKGNVDWDKIGMVVANVNCNFYSPAFFGEPISVITRVEWIHEKSFKMHQRLVNTVSHEVKGECVTIMVGYDSLGLESVKLPECWVKAICEYEGRNLLTAPDPEEK